MTYSRNPERYCFGYMVDVDLKDEWVYALNTLPKNVKLISICSGHKTKTYIECPGFNLDLNNPKSEPLGMKLKHALEDQHTDVEVTAWGGPNGNWVLKSDGNFRTNVFTKDELKSKIKSIGVNIDSNYHPLPENQHLIDKWWERSIKITQDVLGATS